jgi:hypothetical protein
MGLESPCTLKVGRRSWPGRALLESDAIVFRGGETRLAIPFSTISRIEVDDGALTIGHGGGEARFGLGANAARWADRIRNPRSLLDKLGVKPGMRVAVIGIDDEPFRHELGARTGDLSIGRPRKASDLIFFGAESIQDLSRLAALRDALKPNGAIWVVHRKGKAATLKDVEVFAAAKRAGLVDNKVASFSATHTAEKLVIPVALRPSETRRRRP